MSAYTRKKFAMSRPRRGSPSVTRERLMTAAAALFNKVGYYRTDSNRIAAEAGYATGTFYKHFRDKRDVFLAVYASWVGSEWSAVESELAAGKEAEVTAKRLVELSIEFHTKWRGLRASLLELVFTDAHVRRFYRTQRRKQLDLMARLRVEIGASPRSREEDAVHLYTTERTFDAIANGEIEALGLDRELVIRALVERVAALLI